MDCDDCLATGRFRSAWQALEDERRYWDKRRRDWEQKRRTREQECRAQAHIPQVIQPATNAVQAAFER
jgi:hypothetical protein